MMNTKLTGFEAEIICMALEDFINNDEFDTLHSTAKSKISKLLTKFEDLTGNTIEKWNSK